MKAGEMGGNMVNRAFGDSPCNLAAPPDDGGHHETMTAPRFDILTREYQNTTTS